MYINGRLLGLLALLVVCIMLAVGAKAAEPYKSAADYYTCEFLGHCPKQPTGYVPEMWKTVKCYDAVGKVCPKKDEERK